MFRERVLRATAGVKDLEHLDAAAKALASEFYQRLAPQDAEYACDRLALLIEGVAARVRKNMPQAPPRKEAAEVAALVDAKPAQQESRGTEGTRVTDKHARPKQSA